MTWELAGEVFGQLTVVEKASSKRSGCIDWVCKCSCGRVVILTSDHLTRKSNPVRSCGCLIKVKGKAHKDWTGYEEISGTWWI